LDLFLLGDFDLYKGPAQCISSYTQLITQIKKSTPPTPILFNGPNTVLRVGGDIPKDGSEDPREAA
jgi:hypothetical protein